MKELPKPPVPVWAVNTLARREPKALAAVSKTGERLVEAQEQALGGDREGFARARTAHNEAVLEARALLAGVLEGGGRKATSQAVERATGLLRSASLDPEARPLLVAGRLPDELEAAGFSLLAGLELPAAPKRVARRDDRAELKRQLAEARSEAKELRRHATSGARAAKRLRDEAERAERAAAEAEAEASRAEGVVEELEGKVGG